MSKSKLSIKKYFTKEEQEQVFRCNRENKKDYGI